MPPEQPDVLPVYPGTALMGRPLRVAWLFSGGASGTIYCLDNHAVSEPYENVVAVTNDPEASGIRKLQERKWAGPYTYASTNTDERAIRLLWDKPFREDYGKGWADHYYAILVDMLEPYKPDVVACSGWMLMVKPNMLAAFPNRVLNIHPAKMSIVYGGGRDFSALSLSDVTQAFFDPMRKNRGFIDFENLPTAAVEADMKKNGIRRRFTGDDAVFGAIYAGATETFSSIHFADAGKDTGPILLVSEPMEVDADGKARIRKHQDALKDSAYENSGTSEWTDAIAAIRAYVDGDGKRRGHQEEQKWKLDGPVCQSALRLIGAGDVGFGLDGRTLYYRGPRTGVRRQEGFPSPWRELPYGGLKMREADA